MGTNFYWIKSNVKTDETVSKDNIFDHIGKRSAAGGYCWDCGTTLLINYGTHGVHRGDKDARWSDVCPSCGKSTPRKENRYSAAMVELGFTQATHEKLTGVSSCSSFTWTLMKHYWELKKMRGLNVKVVCDEYGREFTADEFLDMVENCPIWDQLPTEFS